MTDTRRAWDATPAGTSRVASLRRLTALALLGWVVVMRVEAVDPHPALAFVERGVIEMRTDPEASKRDADEALRILQQQPDADLEIRARLILCDYHAERDTAAAQQQIDTATVLLPKAHRVGIKAG